MPVFRVSQFTAKRRLARTESLLNALSGRWQWLPNVLSGRWQWCPRMLSVAGGSGCRMLSVAGGSGCRMLSVAGGSGARECSQWPVAVRLPNDLRGCRISVSGCRMITVVAECSQWPVAANVIAVKHCLRRQ